MLIATFARINMQRQHRRRTALATESPQERESRLQRRRDYSRRRARQKKEEIDRRLNELAAVVLNRESLSDEDIQLMGTSQHFTKDPRLALAYYYCCGMDSRAAVYGDEVLNGEAGENTRQRLEQMFADYPKSSDTAACQKLADNFESEATDVWACASCGRLLLINDESKVTFHKLSDLRLFLLNESERSQLFDGVPRSVVENYRQVFFSNDEIYYLIPVLVRDVNRIPLCDKCSSDPRKSTFSVANGHDYGRISNLPVLNDVALNCITPARCFGIDISLSGKHTSGHTICFPSDGPHKVANVLPCVDRECMPRVTFVGPKEEWRIQQKKFKRLYSIPVDDVYEWLSVLEKVNNIFREEEIHINDSLLRRNELAQLELAIEQNVHVEDSSDVRSIQELSISERFGRDIDEPGTETGEVNDLVVQPSAVMPAVENNPSAHGIVGVLLDTLPLPQTENPAAGNTPARTESPVVPIKRGQSPMVEWLENAKMIAGVFPNLFLTGSGPLPSGPLPRAFVDHFMHYWDGRFERSTRFIAMLFNQLQRHTAVRNAARMGVSRINTLREFGKLASTPAFKAALQEAKDDPDNPKTVQLNAVLLRLLSLVGGSVPFSPFERAATRPKLGAMRYRYGCGQHWVTMAPPEQDDLILHRIAQLRASGGWNDPTNVYVKRSCTFSDLPGHLRESARDRLRISNTYPALSAQVFERRLRSFTEALLRCPGSSSTRASRNYLERKPGLYGRVAGFNAVVEPQVDGRLHAHAIVYGGTVNPALLTRAAACQVLWPQVRTWIEAVSCTTVSESTRTWCKAWQDSHGGRTPRAFDIPVPDASVDFGGFLIAAERRAYVTNIHTHSQTCRKGIRGRYMCRLSRPAGIHEADTQPLLVKVNVASNIKKRKRAEFIITAASDAVVDVIDRPLEYTNKRILREHTNGAILWEQHRAEEDSTFVETNTSLACISKSHTNSAIINGLDAANMVEEYQHSYMTKEKGGLKSSAAVMLTALRDMQKYPSVADDSNTVERQAKFLATRTVNAFTGATEWPHQLMAYALAGHRSYLSSDTFWYVFPHQLAKFAQDSGVDAEASDVDDDCSDDEASEGNLSEDEVSDDNESDFVSDSASNVQAVLEKLVHASVNSSSPDTTGSSGRAGNRMYTLGEEVYFVSQAESYRHRGKWFTDYSPLEFEMIVDILPRVEDAPADSTVRRGRPKRRGFNLAPEHPLSPQFQGFIRAKFRTPMLGGAPMPSLSRDGCATDALGKYILCLAVPWTLDGGKPDYTLNADGLVELCKRWNSIRATHVNRERYRVIENMLQKLYRSSKNEKTCSEWRSRNAEYWRSSVQNTPGPEQSRDVSNAAPEPDAEAEGTLPPEEIAALVNASAAQDPKAVALAKAIRATFWSLVPVQGDFAQVLPSTHSDPIFLPPVDSPNLTHMVKRIHAMPPHNEQRRDLQRGISISPRGDAPVDDLASLDNSEEREQCSPDQQALFDQVLNGLNRESGLKQTLCVLHGGGGTGKSHLMKLIAAVLKKHQIETVNTCPTGIGASHLVDGRTFHSAFKTFRKDNFGDNDLELLRLTFTNQVALVVVDEMSMFKAEFLALLNKRLQAIYRTNALFGGRSIILAGDFLQLEVTGGTPLCKALYMRTESDEILASRALFRRFTVFFLESQHRAAGCTIQQANLSACRKLPNFYPKGDAWSQDEKRRFRPMTPSVVDSLTTELTLEDVAKDAAWLDELTILVTTNVDKAILTACTAKLFARRHRGVLFRWRRRLHTDLTPEMQDLIYNEDANPTLFAYFIAGAPAHILDNNSGNVGWGVANGTPCRFHSLAWEDPEKRQTVARLLQQSSLLGNNIVDLPYPPDYINVELLDSNGKSLSAELWPPENNLDTEWVQEDDTSRSRKSKVIIPIGLTTKMQSLKLGSGVLSQPYELPYFQHAVDLGLVRTVWKAQGATLKKVLLFLEPSRPRPVWGFEHLYVGMSRVTAAKHLRCFPLSGAFRKSRLLNLRPNIFTTKWRMDNMPSHIE